MKEFGPNEWLVDEIYQQFLHDKQSVDPAWWDFFTDYQPVDPTLPRHEAPPVDEAAGVPAPAPAAAPPPRVAAPAVTAAPSLDGEIVPLRGPAARVVTNMDASLTVPTATSVRAVPAKLLIDNRTVLNNHLARARGGKVSFTHVIGWAIVRALAELPEMNNGFVEVDGKPALHRPAHQARRDPPAVGSLHQAR